MRGIRVPRVRGGELVRAMLADSPAGLWPLDEATGTVAYDRSGNGRNASYNGSYSFGRRVGRVPAADLSGGYVNVPDDNAFSAGAGASGTFSVDLWVQFDTVAAQMNLITKGAASNYEFDFRLGDSLSTALAGVTYTAAGGALMNTTQTAGDVAVGVPYHLAMTLDYSAKLLIIYRNGVELVRDTTSNDNASSITNGTAAMQIGRRGDAAGATLDGQIGYVGYYPTVLSAARVAAHYAAGIRQ